MVCFLDIKSAYDSVDRRILYQKLLKFGIDINSIRAIRELFGFNMAKDRIYGKCSASFMMPAGVQQGSILNHLLYSIFINEIVDDLKAGLKIQLQDREFINCLLYADDIALIAKCVKDMNILLKIVASFARRNNFLINSAKCAYRIE